MADGIELDRTTWHWESFVAKPVFYIFRNYLRSGSDVSASQAAQAIADMKPWDADGYKTWGYFELTELWPAIFRIVEQIPYDHIAQDKLVKVFRELEQLPDTGLKRWSGGQLWRELPVLGETMRYEWERDRVGDDEEEQAKLDQAWIRYHAFCARLDAAGIISSEREQIWSLRDALEEPNPPQSLELDTKLTLAALYMEYNGTSLFQELLANPYPAITESVGRLHKPGSLFKGVPGLSPERWEFWTDRFRLEAENAKTEHAKNLALRAARRMETWNRRKLRLGQ
ncbi:hypothetical protein F5Y13DRAFT_207131 [Hypoxylon sp. FL1857]|nr:hypothetical protein F5Y13DRAFT_207131 [Hypoxylon sp. FL1857]